MLTHTRRAATHRRQLAQVVLEAVLLREHVIAEPAGVRTCRHGEHATMLEETVVAQAAVKNLRSQGTSTVGMPPQGVCQQALRTMLPQGVCQQA